MESPLQVDDPSALFRVHCPVCRQNVWAGYDPPESGDDVLAEHEPDCPGPEAAQVDDGTAAEQVPARHAARPVESLASVDETVQPDQYDPTIPVSGQPGYPIPAPGGPGDSPVG